MRQTYNARVHLVLMMEVFGMHSGHQTLHQLSRRLRDSRHGYIRRHAGTYSALLSSQPFQTVPATTHSSSQTVAGLHGSDSLNLWPQLCRADVQTYCFGLAASMGAFLLGAGTKGKRYSMPNARIMIHQPLGGASGQAVDIEIQAKEIMYHKGNLNRIMSECTGQPIEKVLKL